MFARWYSLDLAPAQAALSEAQWQLFHQLQKGEQLHALLVLASLRAQADETPAPLVCAALLHDVGKLRQPLSLWSKAWSVLLRDLFPRATERWGRAEWAPWGWRPTQVLLQHPQWGAEMAAAVGCSERVCWLIAEHHSDLERWRGHRDYEWLWRLKLADQQN